MPDYFLLENLEVVIFSHFASEKTEALRSFYMSKVTQLVSDETRPANPILSFFLTSFFFFLSPRHPTFMGGGGRAGGGEAASVACGSSWAKDQTHTTGSDPSLCSDNTRSLIPVYHNGTLPSLFATNHVWDEYVSCFFKKV